MAFAIPPRSTPGVGGFARQGNSPLEAYWLENMRIDRDGTYRPRWGAKCLYTFGGTISNLSRIGGYNARLAVVAGGTLYDIHVETLSPTSLGTGWPTAAMASTIAVTASGTNVWIACKSPIGGSVGSLYKYDGTTLTAISSPGNGNYVGMHGYFAVKIYSGAGDNTALRWSDLGDVDTWPVTSAKQPIPEIGTVDAIVPFSLRESLLFGPGGVATMSGTSAAGMSFAPVINTPVATPMRHIAKCRDAVYFLAPGPSICRYRHPGVVERIEAPLERLLYNALGVSHLRAWYDPQKNYYVLWDSTSHVGYEFSIDLQRWVGAYTFATTGVDCVGFAEIDQGASTLDEDDMPWGKGFFAAGARLMQHDPSLYVDQASTSPGDEDSFVCAIETKPSTGIDSSIEKQCREVAIDGTGSWTVKLKTRSGPDAAWTTTTLGDISAPGKVFPSLANMPVYRECVIRCEAVSASGLRWRSVAIDEVPVGEPIS